MSKSISELMETVRMNPLQPNQSPSIVNAQGQPLAQPSKPSNEIVLTKWMDELTAKLRAFRHLELDVAISGLILTQLIRDGFTMEQAQSAELWMFYGDWTFKGSKPMVELSDFYPSPDKLVPIIEARRAQGVIILSPEQLRKIEGEAYKAGHSDGYRKGYKEGQDKGPVVDALRDFIDSRYK